MKQTFYSNGKLLITGEYVVLDGAKALALPTKFGQSLEVAPAEKDKISWKSLDADGTVWFEAILTFEDIKQKNNFGKTAAVKNTLVEILHHAYQLKKSFPEDSQGFQVTTTLTFPKHWGLGTSSTLINNIAQWFAIDAFELLQNSFGGSGYDIACAQNDNPVLYHLEQQKPIVEPVSFDPVFKENLYFVYLNKKQNSKTAIKNYYEKRQDIDRILPKINKLTLELLTTTTLKECVQILEEHEAIMSAVLDTATVKEALFGDFKGTIKSLGAWGGDFVLVITEEDPLPYFKAKGYETVIPYAAMIK
ncbi:GYDIA family GHMP kinase [Flavobacterium pedocola]